MSSATPADLSPIPDTEPPRDCARCPRLVALRRELRLEHPAWWNAPVPAFGDPHAWLAIIGLAPGKRGANRTGRAFTGDYSGELFYSTLIKLGLARGTYRGRPDDGVTIAGTVIVNAVRCLPPGNRPLPAEVVNCRAYLEAAIAALPNAKVVVALGQIAHRSAAAALGVPKASFAHAAEAIASDGRILCPATIARARM
jgi:uracil-DNA glycosylase family 4